MKNLKKEIKAYFEEQSQIDIFNIADFTKNCDLDLSFNLDEMSNNGSDYWVQAEIGLTINNKYYGIIFDYDVSTLSNYSHDDIVELLECLEKRAKEEIKRFNKLKEIEEK